MDVSTWQQHNIETSMNRESSSSLLNDLVALCFITAEFITIVVNIFNTFYTITLFYNSSLSGKQVKIEQLEIADWILCYGRFPKLPLQAAQPYISIAP